MNIATAGPKKTRNISKDKIGFGAHFANIFYLRGREIGVSMRGAFQISYAALFLTVLNIIVLRTQKNMFRIYANYHVAFMAGEKAIRNRLFEKFVANAMGRALAPMNFDKTISSAALATSPYPATIFINAHAAHKPRNSGFFGLVPHRLSYPCVALKVYMTCRQHSTVQTGGYNG